jgi:hypothetical protein
LAINLGYILPEKLVSISDLILRIDKMLTSLIKNYQVEIEMHYTTAAQQNFLSICALRHVPSVIALRLKPKALRSFFIFLTPYALRLTPYGI